MEKEVLSVSLFPHLHFLASSSFVCPRPPPPQDPTVTETKGGGEGTGISNSSGHDEIRAWPCLTPPVQRHFAGLPEVPLGTLLCSPFISGGHWRVSTTLASPCRGPSACRWPGCTGSKRAAFGRPRPAPGACRLSRGRRAPTLCSPHWRGGPSPDRPAVACPPS